MRILGLLGLVFLFSSARSQNFYDITSIQNISINFGYTNWDYRLDTAKAGSEGYIIAQSCTITCPSSNQELGLQLSIYPNPSREFFTIIADQPLNNIGIYSLTGQKVQSVFCGNGRRVDINMEDFPSGLYFVEVNGKTFKWIKN
jgi:hypothetical protein